jgi:endonuclease/exonuclease/phosphatase family metal-dependent hydrolase
MPEPTPRSAAAQLRVMTYNVRSLRDDVDALASVVRACAPDVLLVQEAPRFARWRSKRAALARRCGLVVATADRTGGLCVLTALRVDVHETSFALLPSTVGHHQRAVVGATVAFGGVQWQVLTVHMSTDAAQRRAHQSAVVAQLPRPRSAPLIVGGDINEDPGGPMFGAIASGRQDCFAVAGTGSGLTSPARSPRRRIDAIFADPSLSVVSCEVVDVDGVEAASDHRPVIAVLSRPLP